MNAIDDRFRWRGVCAAACLFLVPLAHAAPSSLEERIARESRWTNDGLWILPHRPNYFLPFSCVARQNEAPFPVGTDLQNIESKFQFSIKVPVAERLYKTNIQTYVAYTQVSFWQTYNHDFSSLFRDTTYEPEIFFQVPSAIRIGAWTNRVNRLGVVHQSNGQNSPLSKSWNRVYAELVLDHDNAMISFKPWFRLKGSASVDSNPDITNYLGYGELRGTIKLRSRQELSLLLRNNLHVHENKGAVELGWAFPLIRSLKGYVQYFNGYGETLLDYNYSVNRISVGVSFSDWL